MSKRERNESCFSPFYSKRFIFPPSSVELVLYILIWGLSGRVSCTSKGNPICLLSNRRVSGGHHSLFFTDFADGCSYHSRSSYLRCRCFIYGHIIGTIYNYIGIVIGCAIIFYFGPFSTERPLSSLWSAKRTYDKVYRVVR